MHAHYSEDFDASVIEIAAPIQCLVMNMVVYIVFEVKYYLHTPMISRDLRKSLKRISDNWENAGDYSFVLKKLEILSNGLFQNSKHRNVQRNFVKHSLTCFIRA